MSTTALPLVREADALARRLAVPPPVADPRAPRSVYRADCRRRRVYLRAVLRGMRRHNLSSCGWRPGTTLRAFGAMDFAAARAEMEGLVL